MSVVTSIAAVKSSDRRWWVLAIVVVAQFMFVVDAFVVNVAIPSIRADLHATTGEIQGVIVLYQIAFATLIITGGRLGDIRGSKPVFLLGLLGFTLASLWCGLARSGGELVTARAVQGAAAALMIPQVLGHTRRKKFSQKKRLIIRTDDDPAVALDPRRFRDPVSGGGCLPTEHGTLPV